MFESHDTRHESQPQFWIEARRLPTATASTFYRKLDATLQSIGFAVGVREICRLAYADAAKGGRPGIDPAVYFTMLMIGFFENLPSESSIASRCADSLSLRSSATDLKRKRPTTPAFRSSAAGSARKSSRRRSSSSCARFTATACSKADTSASTPA